MRCCGISFEILFDRTPVIMTSSRTGLTMLDNPNAIPVAPASVAGKVKEYPIIIKSGAQGVNP